MLKAGGNYKLKVSTRIQVEIDRRHGNGENLPMWKSKTSGNSTNSFTLIYCTHIYWKATTSQTLCLVLMSVRGKDPGEIFKGNNMIPVPSDYTLWEGNGQNTVRCTGKSYNECYSRLSGERSIAIYFRSQVSLCSRSDLLLGLCKGKGSEMK